MMAIEDFILKLKNLRNYSWELYFFKIINGNNYISYKVFMKKDILKNSFITKFIDTQTNYISENIKSIQTFVGDNSNDVITELSSDNQLIKSKLNNLKNSIDNSECLDIKRFPNSKVGYVLVGTEQNGDKTYIMKKSDPVNKFKGVTCFMINENSEIQADIKDNKTIKLQHYFDCMEFNNRIYSEKQGVVKLFELENEIARKKISAINSIISSDMFDNLSPNILQNLFRTRNKNMFINFSYDKLDEFINNINDKRKDVCSKLDIQLSENNNKLILTSNDKVKAEKLMDYFCGRIFRDFENETVLHADNPQIYN